jgi:hypothetical protein
MKYAARILLIAFVAVLTAGAIAGCGEKSLARQNGENMYAGNSSIERSDYGLISKGMSQEEVASMVGPGVTLLTEDQDPRGVGVVYTNDDGSQALLFYWNGVLAKKSWTEGL